MRRRSLTGPIVLLVIGALFLWKNLHPEAPVFDLIARDWPFLLIGWGVIRLAEVLLTREGRHSSFSGGEVVLVIFICMIGAGMWQASQYGIHFNPASFEWLGEGYDYSVSASAPAKGIVRVVFENPHGNVKVTGADDQADVTVTGHKSIRAYSRENADRTNSATPVQIVQQGDRLLVRTNQDRAPNNERVSDDLEVTVPRNIAVESRGNVGDYEISGVNGDLELAGSRGDVRLSQIGGNVRVEVGRSDMIRAHDLKGKIDIQGRGNDLDLENISGQVTITGDYTGTLDFKNLSKPFQFEGARNTELSAQAVPGYINMDRGQFNGTSITGPVRFMSGSRDVKMQNFTQSLELENRNGDIELQPGTPMPRIEVRSGTGRIELVIPPKATFQLDATAEHGEAVNDFGEPIHQESNGRTAIMKGSVGSGPLVRLVTNRGTVEVRKTESSQSGEAPEAPAPPNPPKTPKDLKDSEVKM